jgi:hypothetical protein
MEETEETDLHEVCPHRRSGINAGAIGHRVCGLRVRGIQIETPRYLEKKKSRQVVLAANEG